MPSRPIHDSFGLVVGLWAACYAARDRPATDQLLEVVGGLGGALLGSRLPDIWDPAVSGPHHRRTAHSVTVALGIATADLAAAQSFFRAKAMEERMQSMNHPADSPRRLELDFNSFVWTLLAGAVIGLGAGYLSHLALDAGTPRGLPIV